jgi:type IX secretion system substrate protein
MKWLNHFCVYLSIILSLSLHAQQVTPNVINSAGGSNSTGILFVDWSVGEMPVILTSSGNNLYITNGFLQAGSGFIPNGLLNLPVLTNLEIKIFPNPVRDELQIQFQLNHAGKIQIILFDISGKKLMDRQWSYIGGSQVRLINLKTYPQGSYQLFLYYKPANGAQPKAGTFKVQKLK